MVQRVRTVPAAPVISGRYQEPEACDEQPLTATQWHAGAIGVSQSTRRLLPRGEHCGRGGAGEGHLAQSQAASPIQPPPPAHVHSGSSSAGAPPLWRTSGKWSLR